MLSSRVSDLSAQERTSKHSPVILISRSCYHSRNSTLRQSAPRKLRFLSGARWSGIDRWSKSRPRRKRFWSRSTRPPKSVGHVWSRSREDLGRNCRRNSDLLHIATQKAVHGKRLIATLAGTSEPSFSSRGIQRGSILTIAETSALWKLSSQKILSPVR